MDIILKCVAKMQRNFLILGISLFMFSCDCSQHINGNIYDEQTKKPVEKVEVQNKYKNWCNAKTDKDGFFELSATSGGLSGCPPMEIIIAKPGYYMKVMKIENGKHENIYLLKREHWQ